MKDLPEKWSVERVLDAGELAAVKVTDPAGYVATIPRGKIETTVWVFLLACADKAKGEG